MVSKKRCPICGHERQHIIVAWYCPKCNGDKLQWEQVGLVKRLFISQVLMKITVCEDSCSGVIDWDVEFYPEQLLDDQIPNLVKHGIYILYCAITAEDAAVYKIKMEHKFV